MPTRTRVKPNVMEYCDSMLYNGHRIWYDSHNDPHPMINPKFWKMKILQSIMNGLTDKLFF